MLSEVNVTLSSSEVTALPLDWLQDFVVISSGVSEMEKEALPGPETSNMAQPRILPNRAVLLASHTLILVDDVNIIVI